MEKPEELKLFLKRSIGIVIQSQAFSVHVLISKLYIHVLQYKKYPFASDPAAQHQNKAHLALQT